MKNIIRSVIVALTVSLFLVLPTGHIGRSVPTAFAASGATFPAPPNHNFEAGPLQLGAVPTNYDFGNGSANWILVAGNLSVSGGEATLTGASGAVLRSASYTLASGVKSVKIRYKVGASASVSVKNSSSFSIYGTDNLSCISCTTGDLVDKYIAVTGVGWGSSVFVEFAQSSGGTTVIDEAGTQWIPFQQWDGPYLSGTSLGVNSQPREDGSQIMEVRGAIFSSDFQLTDNRLEFDYAFPIASGNSLTAEMYRSSNHDLLSSKSLTGNGVGWTKAIWVWGTNYVGETVYLKFSSASSQPSWIDNVGVNFMEASSRDDNQSEDAGDPFDTTTGEFTHSHTDISVPGRGMPLEFTRTYHSMDATEGDLGFNWRHTYSTSLRIDGDGSVTVYYASGGAAYFQYSGGTYNPPASIHDILVHNGDGSYTLTTPLIVHYNFTSAGKLSSIVDRNDNALEITYDGSGFLDEVAEAGERTLDFTTDGNGRITGIADDAGRTVGFSYDANGDLDAVTNVKNRDTTYAYSNHRMTSLTDANDPPHLQNSTFYDDASRVVEQTDAVGGTTCVYYGTLPANTRPACTGSATTPIAGQTVVVDPRGHETIYDFDTSFRTVSITDHLGGVTSFEYDSLNNRTCVTDANGNQTHLEHDGLGNITEMSDAINTTSCELDGAAWEFNYSSMSDTPPNVLRRAMDPRGKVTEYIYDSDGNLRQLLNLKYLVTTTDSDGDGFPNATPVQTPAPIPGVTGENYILTAPNFIGTNPDTYCAANSTANNESSPDGWPFDFNDDRLINGIDTGKYGGPYGAGNHLVSEGPFGPPGQEIPGARFDLNGDGAINGQDTGKFQSVSNTFCPALIQLTCFEYNDGLVTAAVRSTATFPSRPSSATSSCAGNKTKFEYNASGDLTGVISPRFSSAGTPKTVYTYPETDNIGLPESVTNEEGETTSFAWDEFNMLTSRTDDLGNATTWTYDPKGNLVSVTDANRATVGSDPESGPSECGAAGTGDGENDDSSDDNVIDDGCPNYIYEYDAADRLIKTTEARLDDLSLAPVTTYEYDENNNLISVSDAKHQVDGSDAEDPGDCFNGIDDDPGDDPNDVPDDGCPSMAYTYDELDRLHIASDALGRETTYQYDNASNLVKRTDGRDLVTVYVPDDLNRLDEVNYFDIGDDPDVDPPARILDYAYDAFGNRIAMTDSGEALDTTYVYDVMNRLRSVKYGSSTVSYEYNSAGDLSTVTAPGSKTVTYAYNADSTLHTVTDWLSNVTTYSYDDARRVTKEELPNGNWTDYEYDDAGRLENLYNRELGPATISSFEYVLDAVGNRTEMNTLGGLHEYVYDELYRLTDVTYPDPETDAYTYDAVGNRLGLDSTSYTYDVANQMLTAGGTTYGYDENGNMTDAGTSEFTYDNDNRLTSSVIDEIVSTSLYDGDGLRMKHTVDATSMTPAVTNYLWDVNRSLPVILQDGTNTYVYGLGLIAAIDGSNNETYYMGDGLGSTTELTDGDGDVTDTYEYDVFGMVRGTPPSSDNPFQFAGQQTDADSGLQYLRARYYDPTTGRFLGRDPLSGSMAAPSTQQPYGYALSNPVNVTDPTGQYSVMDFLNGLRPVLECTLPLAVAAVDFSCIGDFLNAIERYNAFVLDFLSSCQGKLLAGGIIMLVLGGVVFAGFGVLAAGAFAEGAFETAALLGVASSGGGLVASFGGVAVVDACLGTHYLHGPSTGVAVAAPIQQAPNRSADDRSGGKE